MLQLCFGGLGGQEIKSQELHNKNKGATLIPNVAPLFI
jgi:hypothetical protein